LAINMPNNIKNDSSGAGIPTIPQKSTSKITI
jgi:hypothetical protein